MLFRWSLQQGRCSLTHAQQQKEGWREHQKSQVLWLLERCSEPLDSKFEIFWLAITVNLRSTKSPSSASLCFSIDPWECLNILCTYQFFLWMSNFCSRWIYHVGVQDYLLWCLAAARLASCSCSFYRIYRQPSIHCEHSNWNLCWWQYSAPWAQQTPFMFNISSSTGGNRLHRRVGWILAWQIWSCKDEDLVDQQRYHAGSTHSDNGKTCSYSNRIIDILELCYPRTSNGQSMQSAFWH